MPIYIITLSKIMPGEPTGYISDLFEDAFTNLRDAEKMFSKLVLGEEYFRKEMWEKTIEGRLVLLKEERHMKVYS